MEISALALTLAKYANRSATFILGDNVQVNIPKGTVALAEIRGSAVRIKTLFGEALSVCFAGRKFKLHLGQEFVSGSFSNEPRRRPQYFEIPNGKEIRIADFPITSAFANSALLKLLLHNAEEPVIHGIWYKIIKGAAASSLVTANRGMFHNDAFN